MESTVISLSRLENSRNWGYTAHSRDLLWVEEKLDRSHYPVSKLEEHIIGLTGGLTPRGANYPNAGVIFIRVGNIQSYGLDLADVVFINKELHEGELKRCQLQPNDVLLAITGATFDKACVFPSGVGEANINQHIVRIRTLPDLNPHYLSTFLNSEIGTKQSNALTTGGTRPALDYVAIRSMKIPLPPPEIQMEISTKLQDAYIEASQLRLQAAERIQSSKAYVEQMILGEKEGFSDS